MCKTNHPELDVSFFINHEKRLKATSIYSSADRKIITNFFKCLEVSENYSSVRAINLYLDFDYLINVTPDTFDQVFNMIKTFQ